MCGSQQLHATEQRLLADLERLATEQEQLQATAQELEREAADVRALEEQYVHCEWSLRSCVCFRPSSTHNVPLFLSRALFRALTRALSRPFSRALSRALLPAPFLSRRYWRDLNVFQEEQEAFQNERDSLVRKHSYTTEQLARLRKTSVYDEVFRIWHDGPFGTINNCRLGRLPGQLVRRLFLRLCTRGRWGSLSSMWCAGVAGRLGRDQCGVGPGAPAAAHARAQAPL